MSKVADKATLLLGMNSFLADLAQKTSKLRRWPRRIVAFVAGAATGLAFAPFYAFPLMVVGFSVLVLLVDGASSAPKKTRAAFSIGWVFGFGYFLVSIYWMAFSFFVQAEQFAWMAPFAVIGMPAFLGLFFGGACAVAVRLWRPGWPRIAIFAVVWMIFEYARGHILTGLPWNLPAQALAGTAVGAQTAAWYGAYGLSLVTVILAASPVAMISGGRGFFGVMFCAVGTGLLFLVGAARLSMPGPGNHEDVFVRIVQPNIPQREKIDPDFWGRNFSRHIDLSKGLVQGRLYILWPENAAPLIDENAPALERLSSTLPENAVLLTGSVRRSGYGDETRYHNALTVITQTASGRMAADYYDKHHLVPFGEYLPFESFLSAVGLAQLAPYEDGFTAGSGPRVITIGGYAFSPLICYEAIFPGEIYPRTERPDWIVTVTNDAWFGDTSGPRQHLDQARLRSIETGLPMARSANTGVSALFDAKGRLLGRVKLYEQGRIDAALPKPIEQPLYARIGDVGFLILSLVVLSLGVSRNAQTRANS